ncbi:MAG: C10 family peptidase [Bacteroidales bacterium]|jgi:hypothetical protein|nr:C10 family peptidase [Bacteroidales bacterium]
MRKLKHLKWLTVLIIGGILFSCNDYETFDDVDKTIVNDEFTISKTTAKNIANDLLLVNTTENLSNKSLKSATIKKQKKIKTILEVPDKDEKTAYFIINYEGGGFIILAGDKRSEPILAFSETNEFNLESDYFPTGLVSWLYYSKDYIEKIRDKNEKISPVTEKQWDNIQTGGADVISYMIEPEEPDCTPYVIQKGPFFQTTWGQGCGYNSQTPSMTCGPCGHAWTGCVATAMAQVMKYHQYPTSYSWSSMPNSYGTTTTSILMRDIGDAVNMDYECDGSGADTQDEVASSFRNDFGYSSASYSDYNYQTVKNELNYNRPVILRGGRNTGWWIFGQYSDGHAWVCDGYLNYINPCWGSILKFNMNWGWDGTYNGWYSFNNFNPGDYTFNYKTGMVYNIKP